MFALSLLLMMLHLSIGVGLLFSDDVRTIILMLLR